MRNYKKDSYLIPLAAAANEIGKSGEFVLTVAAEGQIQEHPGRRFSLNELRALERLPTIRNVQRRVTG
jgi:hypothetical protein